MICFILIVCVMALSLAGLCGCSAGIDPQAARIAREAPAYDPDAKERTGQTYDVGEYEITVYDDTRSVEILDYSGTATELEIPAELDGYPVTCIASCAFARANDYTTYSTLTSIVIPDSVTEIGSKAFFNQTALKSIVLPANLTVLGEDAFRGCSALTSITIPQGVTQIGDTAFINCISLQSCILPDTLTSIGTGAFMRCTALSQITLPAGLSSIQSEMFYNCTSLAEVVIPDGVTTIGDYAFCGCASLAFAIIPASVTEIGDSAFNETNDMFEIRCDEGSFAHQYAVDDRIKYRLN